MWKSKDIDDVIGSRPLSRDPEQKNTFFFFVSTYFLLFSALIYFKEYSAKIVAQIFKIIKIRGNGAILNVQKFTYLPITFSFLKETQIPCLNLQKIGPFTINHRKPEEKILFQGEKLVYIDRKLSRFLQKILKSDWLMLMVTQHVLRHVTRGESLRTQNERKLIPRQMPFWSLSRPNIAVKLLQDHLQ